MRSLDKVHKTFSANMTVRCKTQTNWYQVPDKYKFEELIGLRKHVKFKAAHNIHNKTRCQPGSTVIATYNITSG